MAPKSSPKERLDVLLVERGLAPTRSKAQAQIMAGVVRVNGQMIDKVGHQVSIDLPIELIANAVPYVSRGGLKLEAAVRNWPAPIEGSICMDVGASTGGFTDVLLKHNAKLVYAIDVGYGQLDYGLRQNPKVVSMEKTHIGRMLAHSLDPAPSIAAIDVSFISLTKVLGPTLAQMARPAWIYALIKPQFEAGRYEVGKGGIVRDPIVQQACVDKVLAHALFLGLTCQGIEESPIRGADGNVEYVTLLSV